MRLLLIYFLGMFCGLLIIKLTMKNETPLNANVTESNIVGNNKSIKSQYIRFTFMDDNKWHVVDKNGIPIQEKNDTEYVRSITIVKDTSFKP